MAAYNHRTVIVLCLQNKSLISDNGITLTDIFDERCYKYVENSEKRKKNRVKKQHCKRECTEKTALNSTNTNY